MTKVFNTFSSVFLYFLFAEKDFPCKQVKFAFVPIEILDHPASLNNTSANVATLMLTYLISTKKHEKDNTVSY